ncbi:MAG: hypothetical protein C0502_00375 [Opitutus sp.]|nr:hypothetical protein [Opitutus sp.]
MNWRYHIGRAISHTLHATLAWRGLPLMNWFPYGLVWPYDAMRFARTRDLRTIFDVGANVGQTIRHLRPFFPAAQIHAFEPVPQTFATLAASLSADRRVTLNPMALSDTPGEAQISTGRESVCNSLRVDRAGEPTVAVRVETLDRYCAARRIACIDILKIDVEGFEIAVLRGASRLLAEKRVRAIYAEVSFTPGDTGQTQFNDFADELTRHGFVFSGIYEGWRFRDRRYQLKFGNALFWCPHFNPAP